MIQFIEHQEVELRAFRSKLREKATYQCVTFESEELEKSISKWILYMKIYKNVDIEKFSQLLNVWKEIKLPVKIKEDIITEDIITDDIIRLIVIDSENKEFYMELYNYDMDNYFIGRRNVVDRQLRYNIKEYDEIILKESYVGLLNEDGKNKDGLISIKYNTEKQIATAKVYKEERIMEIKYRAEDSAMDNEIMNYLLSIIENDYSNDVIPVVKNFITLLGIDDLIYVEARVKLKIDEFSTTEKGCAKICVEGGEIFDCTPRKIEI